MKNVERLPLPNSLRENSKKWKKDLLAAIANYRKNGKKIPDRVKNKYKQDDVLETLKQMYGDEYGTCYCCYCEHPIEPVAFPHIEHRKPKDMDFFPEEAFNWDNLHLACETCNVKKGSKWDNEHEILDAVLDVPIEDHLSYDVEPEGVFRKTLSMRGITTEKHTDLNRKSLRMARLKIWFAMLEKIQEIKKSSADEPVIHSSKQILIEKCKGRHGSLVKWLLSEWNIIE